MKKKEDVKETSKGKSNLNLILIILSIIVLTLLIITVFYYFNKQSSEKTRDSNPVIIENPMKQIVEQHLEKNEQISVEEIIQEGINNFNVDYINYILLALGVDKLHSFPGFGNPIVELSLDNEIWSSEISDGRLATKMGSDENLDLRFTLSKKEAVKALLNYV